MIGRQSDGYINFDDAVVAGSVLGLPPLVSGFKIQRADCGHLLRSTRTFRLKFPLINSKSTAAAERCRW